VIYYREERDTLKLAANFRSLITDFKIEGASISRVSDIEDFKVLIVYFKTKN